MKAMDNQTRDPNRPDADLRPRAELLRMLIEKYVVSAAEPTRQLLGFARGGKYQLLPTGGPLFLQTANIRLDKKFVKPYNAIPGDYISPERKRAGCNL